MLIITYKEANTVPVVTPHMLCGKQMRACDVHLSCVMSVCYLACTRQNRVQQCMHTPGFEVLHALSVQAHACTCMRVLSCIVNEYICCVTYR